MTGFLTPLQVEEVEDTSHDGRGTWRVLSPLVYESGQAAQTFRVPAGFITDFASVPRIPVAFWLLGDTAHAAAVLHDYLYTTHEVSKDMSDAVLREAAKSVGVPAWKSWLLWMGVKIGGRGPWTRDGQPQPARVVNQMELSHEDPADRA